MRLLLHPGAFALVPILEWVRRPWDLRGMVMARSTWAREGLSVATATLIEPGYEGTVTLALANLGQIPISLSPAWSWRRSRPRDPDRRAAQGNRHLR
jgi:dCTP deaminase